MIHIACDRMSGINVPTSNAASSVINMLKTFTHFAVVLVSLAHVAFMILEATIWPTEFGQKLTHLSASAAQETIGVGLNMAIYNGFVGFALLWATLALSDREAYSAQWLFLTFIIVAGVVGAVTMRNPGIFVAQSLPALIALGLTWLTRPYARTEADAIQQICAIERQILAIKSVDPKLDPKPADGTVPRGQHPKMHGLVEAKFIVTDDLPKEMRIGIFSESGKSFDAVARFSNARNADDQDRGGHGMAIKLLNVGHGAGASGLAQDFVLFDSPVFFVGTPIQYVQFEDAALRAYGKSKAGTLLTSVLSYYSPPETVDKPLQDPTNRRDRPACHPLLQRRTLPAWLTRREILYQALGSVRGARHQRALKRHASRGHESPYLTDRYRVPRVRVPGASPIRRGIHANRGSDEVVGRNAFTPRDRRPAEDSHRPAVRRGGTTGFRRTSLVHAMARTSRARPARWNQSRAPGSLRITVGVSARPESRSSPGTRLERLSPRQLTRAVIPEGVEPPFPLCKRGVVSRWTTGRHTSSGPPGNRTPISWLQARCRPVGPAAHLSSSTGGSRTHRHQALELIAMPIRVPCR